MYTCIKYTVKFKFLNYLKLKYCVIYVGNIRFKTTSKSF